MITEPIVLTQIATSGDHIFGLDKNGAVWFRKKLPIPAYANASATERKKKDDEEEEEARKMWKRLSMMGRIAGDEIPPSKDIPPEIAGPPVEAKREQPAPYSSASLPVVVDDDDEALDIDGRERSLIMSFEE